MKYDVESLKERVEKACVRVGIPEGDAEKLTTVGKVVEYLKSKGYGDDGAAPAQ